MIRRLVDYRIGIKPAPLREGDRMEAQEFLRRFEAMPDAHGIELLDGEVHMPSPISFDLHSQPHASMIKLVDRYVDATPGTDFCPPVTTILAPRDVPEPDLIMYVEFDIGGTLTKKSDGYLYGSPELVVEISASTVHKDTKIKFERYRAAGVREYIVWLTEREELLWYQLRGGEFAELEPDENGIFRSTVFPGFHVDAHALLENRMRDAKATLDLGLASPEHASFVAELASRKSNS